MSTNKKYSKKALFTAVSGDDSLFSLSLRNPVEAIDGLPYHARLFVTNDADSFDEFGVPTEATLKFGGITDFIEFLVPKQRPTFAIFALRPRVYDSTDWNPHAMNYQEANMITSYLWQMYPFLEVLGRDDYYGEADILACDSYKHFEQLMMLKRFMAEHSDIYYARSKYYNEKEE